jgi:hypothetical protein
MMELILLMTLLMVINMEPAVEVALLRRNLASNLVGITQEEQGEQVEAEQEVQPMVERQQERMGLNLELVEAEALLIVALGQRYREKDTKELLFLEIIVNK